MNEWLVQQGIDNPQAGLLVGLLHRTIGSRRA